jgi:hypothetical protein
MTETCVETGAQLINARAALFQEATNRGLVDVAGPWAEQILLETVPDADPVTEVAYHEAGHFRMFQLLGMPVAAMRIRHYADGRIHGVVVPDWGFVDAPPGQTDGQNIGARMRLCEGVGVHFDLDEIIKEAERMVRADWVQIQRIGEHVASCCYSQNGKEWRVVFGAEMIARLFWTREEWQRYGIYA